MLRKKSHSSATSSSLMTCTVQLRRHDAYNCTITSPWRVQLYNYGSNQGCWWPITFKNFGIVVIIIIIVNYTYFLHVNHYYWRWYIPFFGSTPKTRTPPFVFRRPFICWLIIWNAIATQSQYFNVKKFQNTICILSYSALPVITRNWASHEWLLFTATIFNVALSEMVLPFSFLHFWVNLFCLRHKIQLE